jgi:hypothetical protein
MDIINALLIGLIAGILGGLFGIGGGSIIIPALVIVMGYSQHMAQGISLGAMLPPIGILAAYKYWREGNMEWKMAILIATGFILGGYLGAHVANKINPNLMRKLFGFFLLIIAVRMIIKK